MILTARVREKIIIEETNNRNVYTNENHHLGHHRIYIPFLAHAEPNQKWPQ